MGKLIFTDKVWVGSFATITQFVVKLAYNLTNNVQGGETDVQDYIDKLFKALHNFYHPSNLGKWNVSHAAHISFYLLLSQ